VAILARSKEVDRPIGTISFKIVNGRVQTLEISRGDVPPITDHLDRLGIGQII